MKTKVVLFLILTFFVTSLHANNVQLAGTVNIISAAGGTVTMEVDLSWDNSWRDDYNWDAVWLFFKYKEGVAGEWKHAAINASTATVTGGDYTTMSGSATSAAVQGLFVYPSKDRGGNTGTLKVQVQWASSYTKAQFDNNDVFVVCHGIEMVYIPYGAYALGDGSSNGTFTHEIESKFYGPIPESSDVVDNNSGYTITASNEYTVSPYNDVAINAADHQNCSVYPTGSWYAYPGKTNTWWKIDFNAPKTIRYFGVSGATNAYINVPNGIWYLEGSNDNANWTKLSTVSPNLWSLTSISYPVQQSIAVMNPGAYRYYRIYMPTCYNPVAQNIAMTEDVLYVADKYDIVDSENGRNFVVGNTTLSVPAVYPKGYQGFYVMKYETSQEQYVEFLNSLTLAQQTALIPGVDSLNAGDFVFGSNKMAPNYCNGVVLASKQTGKPLMFDNNLNNNKQYSEDADGGTLAMNYMSISDAQGYASWAGLRPMTELEYEKACRRPYPQVPDAGEYAWNSATGAVNAGGLTLVGTATETIATGNVNAGNGLGGPVRCGIFARPNSATQAAAGATYWGVMEMSGNVSELCANITNTTISKTGNGTGTYNATFFGSAPSTYGTRGGGFSDTHTTLATSDRSAVSRFTNVLQRDSSVGFRCAYTYNATNSVNAGTLTDLPTICPGATVTISGTPASASDVKIAGYIWSVNEGSGFVVIPGESGATLTYSNFVGGKTYTFKRKAVCPLGEKEVTSKQYEIPNPAITLTPSTTSTPCSKTITASGKGTVYTWSYAGESLVTSVTYTPSSIDFDFQAGTFDVICRTTVNGCPGETKLTVTVPPIPSTTGCGGTITDVQGNTYTTKLMKDNRCWMTQDMRRTDISYVYSGSCHYSWKTAMAGSISEGAQGICPTDWHIPCESEWRSLELAYGMTHAQTDVLDWRGTDQGIQFQSGGSSGLNMTLSGFHNNGKLYYDGRISFYWSSSASGTGAWSRGIELNYPTVRRYVDGPSYWVSVRCIRD